MRHDSPLKIDDGRAAGAAWSLRLLDDPALTAPTGKVHPLERRAAALLALVAIEPGVSRQRLATLLWPDSDAVQARQALLKRLAADELLSGDQALRLGAQVRCALGKDFQTP